VTMMVVTPRLTLIGASLSDEDRFLPPAKMVGTVTDRGLTES
jgi:hypothetical protein